MDEKSNDELIEEYVKDKDQNCVPSEVNKKLCQGCTKCCEHVALEIDEPTDREDFDNIIWYVMHENVFVYIDHEDDWCIEFKTKCKGLDKEGLCNIHSVRPDVCKNYSQENCEKHGEDSPYKHLFQTREDVIKWIKEKTKLKGFE